jgi:hypothetical protein
VQIKIDDILAALILSLAMLRRIEVRTAAHEQNPHVPLERFEEWRRLALRAYDQVGVASAVKVVSSLGWYAVALKFQIGAPWFQLFGLVVFMAWIIALVWAWKIATDARYLRLQLGIQVRRRSATPQP